MNKMGMTDAIFFEIETPQTPMHVAALFVVKYPEGKKDNFISELMERYWASKEFEAPFNLKPKFRRYKMLLPAWESVRDIDIRQHVRHIFLPKPGTRKQLLEAVAEQHGVALEESKPMWEYTIIEGLDNDCFALYFKMHHAYLDGISGVNLIKSTFDYDPEASMAPPWEPKKNTGQVERRKSPSFRKESKKHVSTIRPLIKAFSNVGKDRTAGKETPRPLPFSAPDSLINGKISEARSLELVNFPAHEIKELAKKTASASRNDIVLAICSGALHRYLKSKNALPSDPLVGFIPVSMRTRREMDMGNRVGNVLCNLGTHLPTTLERLRVVQNSMDTCKAYLQEIPSRSFQQYTIIKNLPLMTIQLLGLTDRFKPPFNIVISNVPGPKRPMYFNGAKIESIYPVSALFDSQGLNVTLISYVDSLHIGLVACQRLIPNLGEVATCMNEEFEAIKKDLGV